MAKYQVLRDCACEDRFFYGGSVMDLTDGLDVKYPKNFKLIEETTGDPVVDTKQPAEKMSIAQIAKEGRMPDSEKMDYDNAPVYVSDKDKAKKSKAKK